MLVASVAREWVIPAFEGVVCAFCPVDCGPVLIPHQCREGGRRAIQLQQEARRISVTHTVTGRRTPLTYEALK